MAADKKILEEKDEAFYLELNETKDKKFTIMYSMSRVAAEVHVIDRNTNSIKKIINKRPNTKYFVEHNRGYFYVITNHDSPEFNLVRMPVGSNILQAETILKGTVCIDEVDMYENNFVIYCRDNGKPLIKIYDIPTGKIRNLDLDMKDPIYSLQPGTNLDYFAKEFTVVYSSPTVYEDTLLYNFEKKSFSLVNSKKIVGAPLRQNNFTTERLEVPGRDGVLIPMTVFSSKDIKKDRKNRLLIKGYGAYGAKHDHSFRYSEITAAEEG